MAGNYIVYIHQNKINGKRYVGITNNPKKRWCGNGNRYKKCVHFWAAIKKYGWENFEHIVVADSLLLTEAEQMEIKLIKEYRTQDKKFGYNISDGGNLNTGMRGRHHSEETKAKMRVKALGRTISKEQRERHSKDMMGLLVGSRNGKSKAVRCKNTGEIFESQYLAAKEKGVGQSKISLCCQGKRKHTKGLQWEFVND